MTDEEKEAIEDLKNNIEYAKKCCREDTYTNQETIYVILNLIQKQQKELEKKDKLIGEMADKLVRVHSEDKKVEFIANSNIDKKKEYIKQCFEKKVSE